MTLRAKSRWTRFFIGSQVLTAAALAVGAALLSIGLADWRYVRFDVSATGRNTLDPALVQLLKELPAEVEIDVFFRPLLEPYDRVALQAQSAMLDLLVVAANAKRDRVKVNLHDPTDLQALQARQAELEVQGLNIVVVRCGERRAVLTLFGDIAAIDWGNPTRKGVRYLNGEGLVGVIDPRTYDPDPKSYRAASMTSFRGAEALGTAVLKVAAATRPKVYFSTGHGEPDLFGAEATDLTQLVQALQQDGFDVDTWEGSEIPDVPSDCEVLALVGAKQPFLASESEAIRTYLEGGGRILAAPAREELQFGFEHGIAALLREYGMLIEPGVVCQTLTDRLGQEYDGRPECSLIVIDERGLNASHALTEPLRRQGRKVHFSLSPGFQRAATSPPGVLLEDLISTPPETWLDLPDARGDVDFRFDPLREKRGRYRLGMLARSAGGPSETEWRLLGLASDGFLTGLFDYNRDFLVNAFNWLTARDYRIRVSPPDPGTSYLEVRRGSGLSVLTYGLGLLLPGLCAAIGAFVGWRRRR